MQLQIIECLALKKSSYLAFANSKNQERETEKRMALALRSILLPTADGALSDWSKENGIFGQILHLVPKKIETYTRDQSAKCVQIEFCRLNQRFLSRGSIEMPKFPKNHTKKKADRKILKSPS
jgi:hypothetical protein